MVVDENPLNTRVLLFRDRVTQYCENIFKSLNMPTSCQCNKKIFWVFMSFVFLLTWVIHYYTPMHSDDYFYYRQGLSLDSAINHYLGWSGRLVADFIARAILITKNHYIISLINTFGHLSLVYLISKIAYGRKPVDLILFCAVFIFYWIANPALGQTTFWRVGAANYMWTNIVICLFLYFYMNLAITEGNINKVALFGLSFLAFISGITNENTSITLFFIALYYAIISFRKNKIPLFLTLLVLAGVLVLVLAPGNFQRLLSHSHDVWREYSLNKKISIELYNRLPNYFSYFWLIFLCCIAMSLTTSKKNSHALIFLIASILAGLALTFAPYMPPRAINGSLVFLLISFAYIGKEFIEKKYLFKVSFIIITGIICCLYFIPSYYCIYYAYKSMTKQSEIRNNLILKGKEESKKEIYIPKFYSGPLIKRGDMIDLYFSENMKEYFDYKGELKEYNINYDYSKRKLVLPKK